MYLNHFNGVTTELQQHMRWKKAYKSSEVGWPWEHKEVLQGTASFQWSNSLHLETEEQTKRNHRSCKPSVFHSDIRQKKQRNEEGKKKWWQLKRCPRIKILWLHDLYSQKRTDLTPIEKKPRDVRHETMYWDFNTAPNMETSD